MNSTEKPFIKFCELLRVVQEFFFLEGLSKSWTIKSHFNLLLMTMCRVVPISISQRLKGDDFSEKQELQFTYFKKEEIKLDELFVKYQT